jgi:hypothetical protein
MKKNYRPTKLNNTQWMDLTVWDYFVIKIEGIDVLITNHPPYPGDTKKYEILWRVQTVINKLPWHSCWFAELASRDNPVEYAKEYITRAVKRKLKELLGAKQ